MVCDAERAAVGVRGRGRGPEHLRVSRRGLQERRQVRAPLPRTTTPDFPAPEFRGVLAQT